MVFSFSSSVPIQSASKLAHSKAPFGRILCGIIYIAMYMILKCPRCEKGTESAGNPYRPFCSEHCKMIDLGNWISGVYCISRKGEDEDENGESPPREDSEKE